MYFVFLARILHLPVGVFPLGKMNIVGGQLSPVWRGKAVLLLQKTETLNEVQPDIQFTFCQRFNLR